ncbi:MAG TPA: hypothetical protein VF438_03910 [Candidatus Paceibacterota bacterium]
MKALFLVPVAVPTIVAACCVIVACAVVYLVSCGIGLIRHNS